MSNDPFTLDMFGSSALSSGLGLGVTAFGGFDPVAANDDDQEPTPSAPAPALPAGRATPPPAPRKQGQRANFYLDDGDRGLAASWKERARINIAAILTAHQIEKQDRPATRDEQAKLIRFLVRHRQHHDRCCSDWPHLPQQVNRRLGQLQHQRVGRQPQQPGCGARAVVQVQDLPAGLAQRLGSGRCGRRAGQPKQSPGAGLRHGPLCAAARRWHPGAAARRAAGSTVSQSRRRRPPSPDRASSRRAAGARPVPAARAKTDVACSA